VARGSRRNDNPGPGSVQTDGKHHEVENLRRVGSLHGGQPGLTQGNPLKYGEARSFGGAPIKCKRGRNWKQYRRREEREP
jgi:hypothetical protein